MAIETTYSQARAPVRLSIRWSKPPRLDGVEPYLWLRHTLRGLPNATTVEHFEALLPWHLENEHLITP